MADAALIMYAALAMASACCIMGVKTSDTPLFLESYCAAGLYLLWKVDLCSTAEVAVSVTWPECSPS